MTINTHDLGRANRRLSIGVLMTVEKPSGSSFGDIAVEGREPDVNLVVAVMGESRRVMGNENVYLWKVEQQRFDFLLLKKVVALGLVFPRPAEPAKRQPAKLKRSQVQVIYRFGEFGAGIMIALHGEDVATSAFCATRRMTESARSPQQTRMSGRASGT